MTIGTHSQIYEHSLPYKLLDYYTANDKEIFFGREREARQLYGFVNNHRLALLYGMSGTGKTSLILAGAGPLLSTISIKHELIYIRTLADPDPIIRQAIRRRLTALTTYQKKTEGAPNPLINFRDQLQQHFNLSELKDLCFEMGIDFENLPGEAKNDKVRELMLMTERRGLIPLLINICKRMRPKVEWQEYIQVENLISVADWQSRTLSAQSLAEFLSGAADLIGANIVLVLDQFEEFFLRLSPEIRKAFINQLAGIYDTNLKRVKVLISLREEWLAQISEIELRIPEVFNNRMRLLPLSRKQARLAITEPVKQRGFQYEESLVDRLLDDLIADAPGIDSSVVIPPQLQLVCSTLFNQLAPTETVIKLSLYKQLGGSRGVLRQYLEDELSRLNFDARLVARNILEELVTSKGTKAVKSSSELALSLSMEIDVINNVLDRLIGARLLRVWERDTDGSLVYELAHEYLINEIYQSGETHARKQTEELIAQEVENWQRLGTLISAEKLALVHRFRSEVRLNNVANELLLRSALQTGVDINYWLEQINNIQQRISILSEVGNSENADIRLRAVQYLSKQEKDEAKEQLAQIALNDANREVRYAAQESLSSADKTPLSVIELLESSARNDDRNKRDAALHTLGMLPNTNLPTKLRWRVRYIRFRRPIGWGLGVSVIGAIILPILILFIGTTISLILFDISNLDLSNGLMKLHSLYTLTGVTLLGVLISTIQHLLLPTGYVQRGLWILLTVVSITSSWLIGSFILRHLLVMPPSWLMGIINVNTYIIVGILFGLLLSLTIGICQWWLLRWQRWAKRWLLLSVGGGVIITIYATATYEINSSGSLSSGSLIFFGMGGLISVVLLASLSWLGSVVTNRRNLVAISASLMLSFFVWGTTIAIVITELQPKIVSQFAQIPITYVGLASDLIIADRPPQFTTIVYEGFDETIDTFSANDFSAIVDVSEISTVEENVVSVQVQSPDYSIELISIDPSDVAIKLERIISKEIPIELSLRGDSSSVSYYGEPLIEPQKITILGIESRVRELEKAKVFLFLDNRIENIIEEQQPIFYTSNGVVASVAGLDVSDDEVMITLPLAILHGQPVQVVPEITGHPSSGYALASFWADPPIVFIEAKMDQIDSLSALYTEPINISNKITSFRVRTQLSLPDGIELVDEQPIFVDVVIIKAP